MLKLLDLTYYASTCCSGLAEVAEAHRVSLGYIPWLKGRMEVQVIKHLDTEGHEVINGTDFYGFRGSNSFFYIPFRTHRYIKEKLKPDIILIQGLGFPLQLIHLRLTMGRGVKLIAQYHGEQPLKGLKGWLQKLAGRMTDAFFFTASGNADPWVKRGIINSKASCHEVLEASTYIKKQDRDESRKRLGMGDDPVFLWVGNLDSNKDPLTVLSAFNRYLLMEPDASLYMVYMEAPLGVEVNAAIKGSERLSQAVHMLGRKTQAELEYLYSAADYYVSASHKEAAGYAIIESMHCGCIPILSDIPPFRKMTEGGKYGLLYECGNADALYKVLLSLNLTNRSELSAAVERYAVERLSFRSIAEDIYRICSLL